MFKSPVEEITLNNEFHSLSI